jgi:hypothetical protein
VVVFFIAKIVDTAQHAYAVAMIPNTSDDGHRALRHVRLVCAQIVKLVG